MQESFLHFLWRFQYFDRRDLRTEGGELLQVLHAGRPHTDAGPDFGGARLRLGNAEWVGNVEIHLRSSDWQAHAHQHDAAYDNVILHVVWHDDQPVWRPDGTRIPTLVLQHRASPGLLTRYQNLLHNQAPIPCASQFNRSSHLDRFSMLDRVLMQRLQQKAEGVEELWKANGGDWEETAYQLLARNYGFKLNGDAFLKLSQSLPLRILRKHRDQPLQLEAMLFGQAGLLEMENPDDYALSLRREHAFLSHKYGLEPHPMAAHEWKFLRLRPANFPTVRLAQFARLLAGEPSFLALLTGSESPKELYAALRVPQSTYWQNHYVWGKPSAAVVPSLGKASVENIAINSAVPLLVSYAQRGGGRGFLERAIAWLEQLPAEHNHVTDTWEELGLSIRNAFDSQASLAWYHHFCVPRRCLQCNVGVALLRSEPGSGQDKIPHRD